MDQKALYTQQHLKCILNSSCESPRLGSQNHSPNMSPLFFLVCPRLQNLSRGVGHKVQGLTHTYSNEVFTDHFSCQTLVADDTVQSAGAQTLSGRRV